MTPYERVMARYALGLPTLSGRSRRNHYAAAYSETISAWDRMVDAGEAKRGPSRGDTVGFALTRKGAEAALDPGETLCPEYFPEPCRHEDTDMAMTFLALRRANQTRQAEWPGNENADVAFRAVEVAGEAGEVAEAVKKYLRAERGIKGSTATAADVANEMADVIIAIDLLADELGIDLGEVVSRKFNATSEKYGLQTRLRAHAEGGDIV